MSIVLLSIPNINIPPKSKNVCVFFFYLNNNKTFLNNIKHILNILTRYMFQDRLIYNDNIDYRITRVHAKIHYVEGEGQSQEFLTNVILLPAYY